MLLTITTTHQPATDLGYLLQKHPQRAQSFKLPFGEAQVFYPEATADRCTAALVLDIDPNTILPLAEVFDQTLVYLGVDVQAVSALAEMPSSSAVAARMLSARARTYETSSHLLREVGPRKPSCLKFRIQKSAEAIGNPNCAAAPVCRRSKDPNVTGTPSEDWRYSALARWTLS